MGIISNLLDTLGKSGTFEREVTVGEVTFTLRVLQPADALLADGITDVDAYIKAHEGEGAALRSYATMVNRLNMVSRLAFIIHAVNGQPVADPEAPRAERLRQLTEFRDDLLKLDVVVQERLNMEYNKLLEARAKFFEAPVENAKK